jgi:CspA family cold shock protein
MGRGRDFRGGGKGRRPFEEDPDAPIGGSDSFQPPQFSRSPSPMQGGGSVASGPVVDAIVKWFNPEKGFGFAEIADGSGDAFLHVKAIQALGRETIPPGAKLSVQVGQGQKGRQITKVLSIISEGDGAPPPARSPSPPPSAHAGRGPDLSSATEMAGTVKWFSTAKGMGFVEVDGGGKDVFVHISVVERAGLAGLSEGQRITMRVVDTLKGRQAVSLTTAG